MKKIKRISLTILLMLTILLSSINIANAESRATFNLTTQNTNVKVGDEVTVTFSIGTLTGLTNVKEITTTRKYDSNIFEYLGVEPQNGWEVVKDETNLVMKKQGGISSGDIAKIKFKVLKEVENTRIQLAEIDAVGSDGEVYFEDENVNAPYVEFKVTVKDPTEPTDPVDPTDPIDPTDPVNPTDPTDPSDPSDPTKPTDPSNDNKKPTGSNTGIKNDKTTATTGKIPQTGEPYMLILLVVVAGLVTVISFIKYKNTKVK